MSEAATSQESGVGGSGEAQTTEEIDTEAFDRVEAPADEGDEEGGEGGESTDTAAAGGDSKVGDKGGEDDLVEVQDEAGQTHKVPKALKDAFMRNYDYTTKTTEVARAREALTTERQTWEQEREELRAALPEEHATVAILNHNLTTIDKQLEGFKNVDWSAWRNRVQGLDADNDDRVKYETWRDAYMTLRDQRIDLGDKLEGAKKDLGEKESKRLAEKSEAAKAELAARQKETGEALKSSIPGWNNETAVQVATFMHTDFGVSPEEISEATDPRLWRMAHRLMQAEGELANLKKTQKQQTTADNHKRAQETKPAETNKGGGGASTRDPSTSRGDSLNTDSWMERRNKQIEARRKAGR